MAVLSESLVIKISGDTKDLEKSTTKAAKTTKKLADETKKTQRNVSGSFKGMVDSADRFKASVEKVRGVWQLAAVAIGAASLPILTAKDAMAELGGVLKITGADFDSTSKKVRALATDIGITYGKAFDEVKRSTTDLGGDVEKAVGSVSASFKAAALDIFTPEEAKAALQPLVNAYGLAAGDIDEAMRVLTISDIFSPDKIGAISGALVEVARPALKAGTSLTEVATALDFLTKRGASAGESAQLIEEAIRAMTRPSEEQEEAANKLNLNYTNMVDVGGRLAEVFTTLAAQTDQNAEAVQGFLGGSESLFAAFEGAGRSIEPWQASTARLVMTWEDLKKTIDETESALDEAVKAGAAAGRGLVEAAEEAEGAWAKFKAFMDSNFGGEANATMMSSVTEFGPGGNTGGYFTGTQFMAEGGKVPGVGSGDTVPAMLTPGEFVIRKEVAEKIRPLLSMLNGTPPDALWQTQLTNTSIQGHSLLDLLNIPKPLGRSAHGMVIPNVSAVGLANNPGKSIADTVAAIMNGLGTLQLNSGGEVPSTTNNNNVTVNIPGAQNVDGRFVKDVLVPEIQRVMERGHNRRGVMGA